MKKKQIAKSREKEASDAYLKFLQGKGAPSGELYIRSKFLDAFTINLADKQQSRKEYSLVLEQTLPKLTYDEKNNALNTAREYFPFWMNDIKAIAMFEEYYGFNVSKIKWQPKYSTLKLLTDALEIERLNDAESQSLNAYRLSLTKRGAEKSVIDTRSKLAKIILLRLKDAPTNNHANYRISVDMTLPLFKTVEIKKLYLKVVREFYYFWINDTDADTKAFG
jgi:hypothetical protein